MSRTTINTIIIINIIITLMQDICTHIRETTLSHVSRVHNVTALLLVKYNYVTFNVISRNTRSILLH